MRVLFVTYPEKTHFYAMAPLAWALRTAGHEVRFASQPALAEVITRAGLTCVPVGRHRDPGRMIELDEQWRTTGRAGLPPPYDAAAEPSRATWEHLRQSYETQVTRWHRMENVPLVAELVAFARWWEPDLVVWEPTTFAGAIAAKACGAAHARLTFGLDIFGVTRELYLRRLAEQPAGARPDPLAEWLAGYAGKYGGSYSEDMTTGHFTIEQLPPSLRLPAGLDYLPVRWIPYGGPAVVPGWLRRAPERPRVVLTLGLVAAERFGGYHLDVGDLLRSLGDLDLEVVATVGHEQRAGLGALPANCRPVPYVPLQALAPTCVAAIHHAGFGTLSTMALSAVPQLLVPGDMDGPLLAGMLARQGCALVATGTESVRDGLLRLLGTPTFADGARRLRQEFEALPAPTEVAGRLAELAVKHRVR